MASKQGEMRSVDGLHIQVWVTADKSQVAVSLPDEDVSLLLDVGDARALAKLMMSAADVAEGKS